MKNIIFIMILFTSIICAEEMDGAISKPKKVVVHVPGMVCQMCVQGMQRGFRKYVKSMEKDIIVNLDDKTVTLKLATEITEKQIKEKVKDAGYNVKKIIWANGK